ncbi:D-ribose-binding periplasmic protein precursor [Pseudovibrio axinellae]|uniref:D-ribose-binding periplasmic protein n=1 Tax=Pseudovibrio axinellae TaxID=989403 RepID=A0A166BB32_9HYPH|nr:sugar ABC transporter substrate-binding protein [Pseudovibrio axinellae]KZL22086.1 D-ribose-binding periplasmic protein precursor [Pseudovibrio axinellae]SEQ55867.1 monosaccharide ABC transporter substrate-binding protein, CUT2 family [Pseudovibrio axinellae]
MKFKKFAVAAATSLVMLASAAQAEDKPVVGLIMKSLANEFFQNMLEGAKAHEKQRGDYKLLAVGMQNETDFESQINAVENFITQGVDAIVVAPADSRAMVRPLKKAMAAGIVVVNFDVALDEEVKKQQGVNLAFVGPDNRSGAKMAGDALAKKLGKGGKVVIIEGNPGADNGIQRARGFRDTVAEYGLDLVDSRTAHWETEEANSVFSNMLTAHPDIQGVMAANDSMAIGVVKALESAGRDDIMVVGFDNIDAVGPMIYDGRMLATVDQFGQAMAANAISMALEVVAGGPDLEGWVTTPIELVVGK